MKREFNIINKIIRTLDLDLRGYNILTEVGSNNYAYTPIIALLSGAEKVFAWTSDSLYGKGEEIIKNCKEICVSMGLKYDRIEFVNNKRPKKHILSADIITNLGHVRPISKDFLKLTKLNCVIPYMCESWEYRSSDVDLAYCKEKSIKVAGTWENHPDLLVFNYCGNLIAKICLEAGFEILNNNILIVSDDNFGKVAKNIFLKMGAKLSQIISCSDLIKYDFNDIDFILLADYKLSYNIFNNKILDKFLENNISIIHLAGPLDFKKLRNYGINVFPKKDGFSKKMSFTLDYLGPKPVIYLHAGGMKVGELLLKNKKSNLIQKMT